jgi:DNA-directed RNA polymerase specialized sigma24 family protein
MARTEWVEHRLRNWQRWRLSQGAGVLGYARVRLGDTTPATRDPYQAAPVPTNAIEAGETDDAVQRLPGELKATVVQCYLGKGGHEDHARYLCCSLATMYRRLERADRLLAEHFTARADKAREERARVEALQRQSPNAG